MTSAAIPQVPRRRWRPERTGRHRTGRIKGLHRSRHGGILQQRPSASRVPRLRPSLKCRDGGGAQSEPVDTEPVASRASTEPPRRDYVGRVSLSLEIGNNREPRRCGHCRQPKQPHMRPFYWALPSVLAARSRLQQQHQIRRHDLRERLSCERRSSPTRSSPACLPACLSAAAAAETPMHY